MSDWMKKLTKDFGMVAADVPKPAAKVIKLMSPSFNWAVGNGGLVEGKSILLFGPESGGKSLLQQLIYIQLQKKYKDGICVHCDAEYSFNPVWFEKLGGDLSRLIIRPSNDPVKIFDWIETDLYAMLQDGAPVVGLGIDSVKAIRFPRDIKKKSTDVVMAGGGASYLSAALKAVLPVIREHTVTTVLVQQVYEEMDQYKKMNNPWIVPDGRALKHFSDYMLQVERVDTKEGRLEAGKNIYGGAAQIGHKVRIKAKKNRVGAPYRVAEFSLNYDQGIINIGNEVFDLARALDLFTHPDGKPTLWQLGDHPPIRSLDALEQWVVENPSIQDEIMSMCNAMNETVTNSGAAIYGSPMNPAIEDGEIDVEELGL